jgi:hypothetical protein
MGAAHALFPPKQAKLGCCWPGVETGGEWLHEQAGWLWCGWAAEEVVFGRFLVFCCFFAKGIFFLSLCLATSW